MNVFDIHELLLILTSIFITAGVFNLALYFGYHKKLDYLFFSFYCAFHVFKVWLKTFPSGQLLLPSLSLTAFDTIYISVILGLFSLNGFLLYHYGFENKKIAILGGGVFSIIAFLILSEDLFIYIGISSAITQGALRFRNQSYGWIYLAGLIVLLILTILGNIGYLPFGYFIGTILMILLMVISTGITLSMQTKRLNEATLKSARLENQLLKKSIQPHFVLNSLTSLQELIEQQPKKASLFVEDLSEVFSVFSKVCEHKLITIKEELNLVNSFLKVMSVRMDKKFNLSIHNLNGEELIPPGVLLTLIENGVTHGFENQVVGQFIITKELERNATVFTIDNNGVSPSEIKEGLGLQYVRSRLEEAFGSHFNLELKKLEHGFRTKITVTT
uniref:sensor histidine kinase n=1 Tax=Fulvivirga sp. TaxID=1931237 RepID=UPI00404AA4D3